MMERVSKPVALIHPGGKTGVLVHVGDEDGLARLGHGAGDPFPRLQADALDRLQVHPHRHRK